MAAWWVSTNALQDEEWHTGTWTCFGTSHLLEHQGWCYSIETKTARLLSILGEKRYHELYHRPRSAVRSWLIVWACLQCDYVTPCRKILWRSYQRATGHITTPLSVTAVKVKANWAKSVSSSRQQSWPKGAHHLKEVLLVRPSLFRAETPLKQKLWRSDCRQCLQRSKLIGDRRSWANDTRRRKIVRPPLLNERAIKSDDIIMDELLPIATQFLSSELFWIQKTNAWDGLDIGGARETGSLYRTSALRARHHSHWRYSLL